MCSSDICFKETSRSFLNIPLVKEKERKKMLRSKTTVGIFLATLTSYRAAQIQLYGLNYSPRQGPDWDSDKCKSKSDIEADLRVLKDVTSRIRIYSLVDCQQGEIILDLAKKLSMQVWLGLWVGKDDQSFNDESQELKKLLNAEALDSTTVLGVSVGSEAIYRKDVTTAQAISKMKEIKNLIMTTNADLASIPVTIVDITDNLSPDLVAEVDVVAGNNFPFWNRKTTEATSPYLVEKLDAVMNFPEASGKGFVLTETGWSSSGQDDQASEASPANQASYLQNFYCDIAIGRPELKYFYFSAFDDAWRLEQDGKQDSVEGGFGLFDRNRNMKPKVAQLSFSCDGSSEVYTWSDEVDQNPNPKDSDTGDSEDTVNSATKTAACSVIALVLTWMHWFVL